GGCFRGQAGRCEEAGQRGCQQRRREDPEGYAGQRRPGACDDGEDDGAGNEGYRWHDQGRRAGRRVRPRQCRGDGEGRAGLHGRRAGPLQDDPRHDAGPERARDRQRPRARRGEEPEGGHRGPDLLRPHRDGEDPLRDHQAAGGLAEAGRGHLRAAHRPHAGCGRDDVEADRGL
ncbi:MAG: hypothetical protein AVDCRST_MAG27-3833, partial [uncultured Craurococcus sp.]